MIIAVMSHGIAARGGAPAAHDRTDHEPARLDARPAAGSESESDGQAALAASESCIMMARRARGAAAAAAARNPTRIGGIAAGPAPFKFFMPVHR
jgi:hypothetical protein